MPYIYIVIASVFLSLLISSGCGGGHDHPTEPSPVINPVVVPDKVEPVAVVVPDVVEPEPTPVVIVIEPVEEPVVEPIVNPEVPVWAGFALIGVPGAGGGSIYDKSSKIGLPQDDLTSEGKPEVIK